jgi:predicted kinase
MAEVIAFAGLPGTGKSTLAEGLATRTGIPAFAGDWLLGSMAPHGIFRGMDRPTLLATLYGLLGTLIRRQLMVGQSAIVDAVLNDEKVAEWAKLASEHGGRLVLIQTVCSDEGEHRRRLEGRTRGIPGWHEVGWDHVERMRREFPPITGEHLMVDAMDSVDHNLEVVLGYIRRS